MKKILLTLAILFGLTTNVFAGSISVDDFLEADDVTIEHLQTFKTTVVDAINSADGGLLQSATVTTEKLDANANPENFRDEVMSDFVYTGLIPPTTSSTLTSTTTAGTAYINGVRVVKDATAHLYTASRYTFVDLSDTGTYTYVAITTGGTEPSTTVSSIRLARVTTDASELTAVRDDRVTTVTIAAGSVTSLWDADADTGWQVQETADEDILRGDTGGTQRIQIDSDGVTLESGASVNEFSTDGTLAGNSDDAVPTEKAVKTYADTKAPTASPTFTGTINLTGGQIAFPATAVPSADPNTIDEYEEGYFTSTLTCGTSGTITLNTSYDQLKYTKIGREVFVGGRIVTSAINAPVGNLILNLPFEIKNLTEMSEYFSGSVHYIDIDALAVAGTLTLDGTTGSVVSIKEQTTTNISDAANHINADCQLSFSFNYVAN